MRFRRRGKINYPGKRYPLVLWEWATPSEHLRAAESVNPTDDLINVAITQRAKLIIYKCSMEPEAILFGRSMDIWAFRNFATNLDSFRDRWTRALPGGSPARFPFPADIFLDRTLEYTDRQFIFDLAHGMPISGAVAKTPGLADRKKQGRNVASGVGD